MFFLIFLLLVQPVCNEKETCKLMVSPSGSNMTLCVGEKFNLTCRFECLSKDVVMELLKNKDVLSSISQSSTTTVASLNASLSLLIPRATETDSGKYTCRTTPPYGSATQILTIKACPSEVVPTDVPPTLNPKPTSSWDLQKSLMWYLLCKTGVFLMCCLSVGLKSTRLKH